MRGLKGQVTIFAIIGLVLIIVVAFGFYMRQIALEAQFNAEAEKTVNEFLQANAINFYVESCLDRILDESLTLLTEQGGVLYDYQGGLYDTTIFEKGIDYIPYNYSYTYTNFTEDGGEEDITVIVHRNVSYAIEPRISCDSFSLLPSDYPVKEMYFSKYYLSYFLSCYFQSPEDTPYMRSSGYFGYNNLPRLCYYDGANKPNPDGFDIYPCPSITYDKEGYENSLQYQIQEYVKVKLPQCVNFSVFQKRGDNITVIEEPDVTLTFQKPEGMILTADYPFEIALKGRLPIQKQVKFQTRSDFPIQSFYKFVFALIHQDVLLPEFSIIDDWNNVSAWRDDYKNYFSTFYQVTVLQNHCDSCQLLQGGFDDLVVVRDLASDILGSPSRFLFAIKNRRPALDYLHDPVSSSIVDGIIIDYQYLLNSTIIFEPVAIDPDGDEIRYEYEGWREDYATILDFECCADGVHTCTVADHQDCLRYITDADGEVIAPHNWTNSILYQLTNSSAIYQTENSDAGLHQLRIIVREPSGKMDYQDITILIYDMPTAVLEPQSIFPNFNPLYASVEDPYKLDGSNSQASFFAGGDLTSFYFNDSTEPFFYVLSDPDSNPEILILSPTQNILNISLDNFLYSALNGLTSREHLISLYVEQEVDGAILYSLPTYVGINVSQCTPYVDPLYPIYPYSNGPNVEYGEFLTDHFCCEVADPNPLGNPYIGKYVTDGRNCKEDNFRTCFSDGAFKYLGQSLLDSNNDGVLEPAVFDDFSDINVNDEDLWNDVFYVEFSQSCSGTRGNVCSGNIISTWNNNDPLNGGASCNDKTGNEIASCQGPGVVSAYNEEQYDLCQGNTRNNLECENYLPGQSFELTTLGNQIDDPNYDDIQAGLCNPNQLRSKLSIGFNDYGVNTGDFLCKATCNDGSCDFVRPRDCVCPAGNSCSGISGSVFDFPVEDNFLDDVFYCSQNNANFACLNSCDEVSYAIAEEACYCKTTPNSQGSHNSNVLVGFNMFFDSANYVSSQGNGFCCVDNVYIGMTPPLPVPPLPVLNDDPTITNCYDGQRLFSGTVRDNVLSCNGYFVYCGNNPNLGISTRSANDGDEYCGKTCDITNQAWIN